MHLSCTQSLLNAAAGQFPPGFPALLLLWPVIWDQCKSSCCGLPSAPWDTPASVSWGNPAESQLGHFTCGGRDAKFSTDPESTRCYTVQFAQRSSIRDLWFHVIQAASPYILSFLWCLEGKTDILLFSCEIKSWKSAKYHVVIKSISHTEIPRKREDL